MKLRWRITLGFMACAIVTTISVAVGSRSIDEIFNRLGQTREAVEETIKSEQSRVESMNQIREYISAITTVKDTATLSATLTSGEGAAWASSAPRMTEALAALGAQRRATLEARAKQARAAAQLQKHQALVSAGLGEIRKRAGALVDTIQFDAVIALGDSMEAAKETAGKGEEALSSALDKSLALSEKGLEQIQAALNFKANSLELGAQVSGALLTLDPAQVKYTQSLMAPLISATRAQLKKLPDSDDKRAAEAQVEALAIALNDVFASKLEMLAAAEELEQALRGFREVRFGGGAQRADAEPTDEAAPTSIQALLSEADETSLSRMKALSALTGDQMSESEASARKSQQGLISIGVGAVLLALLVGFIVLRSVSGSIRVMADTLRNISEGDGDLTARLEIGADDEIGEASHHFNLFVEKLHGIIVEVQNNSVALSALSEKISSAVSGLLEQNTEVSDQTSKAATAAEELTEEILEVSQAISRISGDANSVSSDAGHVAQNMDVATAELEQSNLNIKSVVAASEEISSTINEIAQNTARGREISSESVEFVQNVSEHVQALQIASNEIEEVTEMIVEIADQTQNLALNATIEAARAGEAGRGFSVVANEVKELAKQSNDATVEIQARISAMRSSTESTVDKVSSIIKLMRDVDEIVDMIAVAVEQQSATVEDNSREIVEAADALRNVSTSVVQTNDNISSISQLISNMARGSASASKNTEQATTQTQQVSVSLNQIKASVLETQSGIEQIKASSLEMAEMAHDLRALVGRFSV